MYGDPTMQMMFKLLTLTGCNPTKGYCTSQVALFIFSVASSLLATVFLLLAFILNEDLAMNDVLDTLSGLFYTWQSASKTISMFYMKRDIKMIFDEMETFFWIPKSEEYDQSNKFVVSRKLVRKTIYMYVLTTYGALSLYIIIPLLKSGNNFLYTMYSPTWIPFELLFMFQVYIGATHLAGGMLAFDMMFMIILTYTRAQFEMLNEELKCIFDADLTNEKELQSFKSRMKACIEHHDFLMRHSGTISNKFSVIVGAFFVTVFLCDTLETYRIVNATELVTIMKSCAFVTAGVVAMSSMCYFIPAQLLRDEAGNVCENIYSSKWYNHIELAKPLVMIVARSHNLVEIKPCGIWELNLQTGLTVVKSMVSYATFLKTVESAT